MLPQEILDLIASYVGDELAADDDGSCYRLSYSSRQRLANMRLANKALSFSASPCLFKHIVATFTGYCHSRPLERLRQLVGSEYVSYVRQLDIGIRSTSSESEALQYAEDLAGLLSSCVCRLPNLCSLDFIFTPGHSLSQETRKVLVGTIISTLRYINLPNLKELDISFPLAHDFGSLIHISSSISCIPPERLLERLRHLGMFIHNHTSEHDQRYWVLPASFADMNLPNSTFGHNLTTIVQSAKNLTSFAIGSKDILQLHDLTLPPTTRLAYLSLCSVALGAASMINLVLGNCDNMKKVQLIEVELNNGSWQHVLLQIGIAKLPKLTDFYMTSCGYSKTGESLALRPRLLPPPYNSDLIETNNSVDIEALKYLQRQVLEHRMKFGFPQKYEYEYVKKYSLEYLLTRAAGKE